MKIGVDLDEVLAETVEKLLQDNDYKLGNLKINKDKITSYYIYEIENIGLSK